jgi:bifunctional ADP-heptose synthase (sugar kinase/adenylyltransferase)
MRVDILFESTSHSQSAIRDAKRRMALHGGKVLVLPYYGGCSTTQIKNEIKTRRHNTLVPSGS